MGVISGIVTYSNGQPSTMSYVSAFVGGTFSGGVTSKVKTDSNGRFVLSWNGDGPANIVYLDGQEVAKNVPNGTSSLHFHVR
jgi:hypothetical protein